MADYRPRSFDPGPIMAQANQDSTAHVARMDRLYTEQDRAEERDAANRERRAAKALEQFVAAGNNPDVTIEAALQAYGGDIPQHQKPIAIDAFKSNQKQAKAKAKQQKDAETGETAGALNLGQAQGATEDQQLEGVMQKNAFLAGGGNMTSLGAAQDTQAQGAAAAGKQQDIENMSEKKKQAIEMWGVLGWQTGMQRDNERLFQSEFEQTVIGLEKEGALEPGESTRMRVEMAKWDLYNAKHPNGDQIVLFDPTTGNIIAGKGTGIAQLAKAQANEKSMATLQDRMFGNDISLLYMREMRAKLASSAGPGIVGLTGTFARYAQKWSGRINDLDILLGTDMSREFRTVAAGASDRARQALAGTDYKGAKPVVFQKEDGSPDRALAAKVEKSIMDFDVDNAAMPAISYLVAFNAITARQRGTRVVTGKAIEMMEKQVALRSAKSRDQIIASLDVMIRNGEFVNQFFEKQFKQYGGTPIHVDPGKVNTEVFTEKMNAAVEATPPSASGPLDALGPPPAATEFPDGVTIREIK
jgi:hypothetical protein